MLYNKYIFLHENRGKRAGYPRISPFVLTLTNNNV